MTRAGAMDFTVRLLRAVRWGRFVSARFWGAALAAVLLAQLVITPANAPSSVSAGADRKRYVGFSVALRRAYEDFVRSERALLGADFHDRFYVRHLQLLDERYWPAPVRAETLGLDGPTGVAVDEARTRLMRLYAAAAREAHPQQAAAAQAALECWATRAAARRDPAAVAECEHRFFAEVTAIEDALLPLKTPDPFYRRLAREYLAYAHYKSAAERDEIDARHFAGKGLRAAESQPVEPEELDRWFGIEREEARDLAFWRIRLELALGQHRFGTRAFTAAIALARYDCWIERAAERAAAAPTAKCRGEFIDAMRALEGDAARPGGRIEVRFDYDQLALAAAERAKIARAAKAAIEHNAFVSVAAVAAPRGHPAVEARQAWRRGETVLDELLQRGVPADRIRLVQRPSLAAENVSGARRVDIVLE